MYGHEPPQRPLQPIVRPGAPPWALAIWTSKVTSQTVGWQALCLLGMVVMVGLGMVVAVAGAPALGIGIMLSPVILLLAAMKSARRHVFQGPAWRVSGVAVKGVALDMVEDIQMRFDYAQRLVREVPTGIEWDEVKADVATLLWESVEQAARVSVLDDEIHEMRYAQPGTPQAALLRQLQERRQEHWQVLLDNQREAELLAREAGNAAAAARVALARTGSMRSLEVVVPSRRAIAARGALAEARSRLSMLAGVWAELDETGALEGERLGLNQPRQADEGQDQ